MLKPKLTLDLDHEAYSGGTVTYRVTIDGRWIGWVGDMRPWRGSRYGGRQWWACWREDGDDAARWNTFSHVTQHGTRAAALADLLAQVEAGCPSC